MTEAKTFRDLARVNTGSHMLDSGGAYGRHHEKGAIPKTQPLEYASGDLLLISTAMLFEQHTDIDAHATRHFQRWADLVDPRDERDYSDLEAEYIKRMCEKERPYAAPWDHGGEGVVTGNSYNSDTSLDQDFQWAGAGFYGPYLVRFHNGCDIRGGYTAPVVCLSGEGISDILCSWQLDAYCYRCQVEAADLYQAERDGWRARMNARSVSLICPKCKRVAMRFPQIN